MLVNHLPNRQRFYHSRTTIQCSIEQDLKSKLLDLLDLKRMTIAQFMNDSAVKFLEDNKAYLSS